MVWRTPVLPLALSCQGRNAGQASIAENTCTRPGASPRCCSISAMRSSLRKFLRWMYSMFNTGGPGREVA